MKNIIFTISMLFTVSVALAQEVNVPSEASKTFESFINSNKDCENILWTQKGNNYIASYQKGKINHTTTFNSEGNFIENLEEVSPKTLSENVLNYIDENFSKAKIGQCFSQTSDTAPSRSVVEIKQKGVSYKLFFRPDGTFHYQEELK